MPQEFSEAAKLDKVVGKALKEAEAREQSQYIEVFPSDGLRRYGLSILTTSGGSQVQSPLKQGSNQLHTLVSRKCPFSNKTNPHLQPPGTY